MARSAISQIVRTAASTGAFAKRIVSLVWAFSLTRGASATFAPLRDAISSRISVRGASLNDRLTMARRVRGRDLRSWSAGEEAWLIVVRVGSAGRHASFVETENGRDDANVVRVNEKHRVGLFAGEAEQCLDADVHHLRELDRLVIQAVALMRRPLGTREVAGRGRSAVRTYRRAVPRRP